MGCKLACLIVTLLRIVLVCGLNHLVTNQAKDMVSIWSKHDAIECRSRSEITFQFIRSDSNETVNIAECLQSVKTCHLMDNSFAEMYTIAKTAGGGILILIVLNEDTFGTYQCCETYSPSNCERTELVASDAIDTTTFVSVNVTKPGTVTSDSPIVCTHDIASRGILICSLIILILIAIHLAYPCIRKQLVDWEDRKEGCIIRRGRPKEDTRETGNESPMMHAVRIDLDRR